MAFAHQRIQLVDLLQDRAAAFEVGGADIGQGDTAGCAVEQLRLQLVFQVLDIFADQLGRDAKTAARSREGVFPGDGNEGTNGFDLVHWVSTAEGVAIILQLYIKIE
ncbi:hypothetical protein QW131_13065 [Roseibium salinum]|nr:hypothetical protein [Roseibium salinum]